MNSLKLKQLRSESNYTQSKVARLLYISQSTYAAYETGKVDPPIDILKKMAVLFNVSTDYLLDLTDKKTTEELSK